LGGLKNQNQIQNCQISEIEANVRVNFRIMHQALAGSCIAHCALRVARVRWCWCALRCIEYAPQTAVEIADCFAIRHLLSTLILPASTETANRKQKAESRKQKAEK
jgi:hypothetical protein